MSEPREIHPLAFGVITLMTVEATEPSEITCPPELAAKLEPALLELSGTEELRFALSGLLDFVNALEHQGAIDAAKTLLAAIETKAVLAAVRALNETRAVIEHEEVSLGKRRFLRMTGRRSAPSPAAIGAMRPASSVTIDELSFPKYI